MTTEHFENQITNFENKVKDDSLHAFNEMLASFKTQSAQAQEIAHKIKRYRNLLSEWAEKAHYKVNWDKFSAAEFKKVGDCSKCTRKNIGLVDYNGHGCWVCESCNDRLEREFEDEYK